MALGTLAGPDLFPHLCRRKSDLRTKNPDLARSHLSARETAVEGYPNVFDRVTNAANQEVAAERASEPNARARARFRRKCCPDFDNSFPCDRHPGSTPASAQETTAQ